MTVCKNRHWGFLGYIKGDHQEKITSILLFGNMQPAKWLAVNTGGTSNYTNVDFYFVPVAVGISCYKSLLTPYLINTFYRSVCFQAIGCKFVGGTMV